MLQYLQALQFAYPEEAIQQNSDVELFQTNSQMAFSTDVSMGQIPDVINVYEQSRNLDTVVHGDTGIRIRTRQGHYEQPNMNPMVQGSAPRRIRLGGFVTRSLFSQETPKGKSFAPENQNSETIIAEVRILFI